METECIQTTFPIHPLPRREVTRTFDSGHISSDGGGLPPRETERIVGVIRHFADCSTDYRKPELTGHAVAELVGQRTRGLTHGYEDLNDHDELRHDPPLAVLVGTSAPHGRSREDPGDRGKALAGKRTLGRLELTPA